MGHKYGYARVSTTEQTPALQSDALTAYGCERIFTDTASGSTTARPALTELLATLLPGDTLCVWRLDRLGRNLPHLIELVTSLRARGVLFASVTEQIDTTTANGELIFHIFGALASFERQLLRERTHAGLAAARERGKVGGRPPALTPSKKREATRMRHAGSTVGDIAEVLGVSKRTLYRHFQRSSVRGIQHDR
ncbi:MULTISPECIES: recombinase family protein [unclassified Rhodococcus (in: high G+C Gram-positive bacteria)]|uniref:recombinase family protein n=1 Tax=unclassified Rhodococcus (in: high G+C Gram-positive bacteria) TaxID=192944 RepID=UPI0027E03FBA|nr:MULTISPECIES: recombinase family protein [unclassified Rhodococcus (in: high G+C Gram-positive bacteria)]